MTVFETRKPMFLDYIDFASFMVILLSAIAAVWLWKTVFKDKTMKLLERIVCAVFAVFSTWLCLLCVHGGITHITNLHTNYQSYISEECNIVEGYVEDFHPMPEELHDTERFTVDGQEFFYSADNSTLYYSRCKKDGGYITGNGIKVKIWYLSPHEIMRLDILE